jgi:hypothetical protein
VWLRAAVAAVAPSAGRSLGSWGALTTLIAVTGSILYVVLWPRRISPGANTPITPTLVAAALVVFGAVVFFAGRG